MARCISQEEQRGVALIIALLILLILTLLGISAIQTTTLETSIAGNLRIYNMAFNAADGGIDSFRGMLSLPFGHPNRRLIEDVVDFPSTLPAIPIGESICKIRIQDISDREEEGITYKVYTIRSEGIAPNLPVRGKVTIEAVIEVKGSDTATDPTDSSISSPSVNTNLTERVKLPPSAQVRTRSWREIF